MLKRSLQSFGNGFRSTLPTKNEYHERAICFSVRSPAPMRYRGRMHRHEKFSCHLCYLLFDFLKSPLSGKGRSCVRRQLQAATLLSPDFEGRDIPHLYMKYISAFVCPRQTRILSRFCPHGQTRCVSRLCLKDIRDKTPTLSLSF